MGHVIHRRLGLRRSEDPPRVLLVGGDGRWARPLLRLIECLGFQTAWLEEASRSSQPPTALDGQDLVLVADPRAAHALIEDRTSDGPPIVLMTGSRWNASSVVSGQTLPLTWPITLESLRAVMSQKRTS